MLPTVPCACLLASIQPEWNKKRKVLRVHRSPKLQWCGGRTPLPFIKFQRWPPCPCDFETSFPFLFVSFLFLPFRFSFPVPFPFHKAAAKAPMFHFLSTKLLLKHQCPWAPKLLLQKLHSSKFVQLGSSKVVNDDTQGWPHAPEHKFAKFEHSISSAAAELPLSCSTKLLRVPDCLSYLALMVSRTLKSCSEAAGLNLKSRSWVKSCVLRVASGNENFL